MNLQPSDEQIMLRDMVRRFLANQVEPAAIGQGPLPTGLWRGLADLGVFAFLLPESAGGMDGGPQDAMIVAEELGQVMAVTPFAEGVLGAVDLVARFGDAGQVERWAAPAIAGETVLALAIGRVTSQGAALSGRCDFVRWAPSAAAFVVVAGHATQIVSAKAAGLTLMPSRLADGSLAATVTLDNCVGEPMPLAADAVVASLALVQLGYVAEMVGAMSLLYEQTVAYAKQRKQFGAAISTFQVVQHKLARMFVDLEQARSMLVKAGVATSDAAGFVRGVQSAKAYVAVAAQRLAEEAVQLHGGMGVTDELVIGRGLRRILVLARLFGNAADARRDLAA